MHYLLPNAYKKYAVKELENRKLVWSKDPD
jgi:hypothetical protein